LAIGRRISRSCPAFQDPTSKRDPKQREIPHIGGIHRAEPSFFGGNKIRNPAQRGVAFSPSIGATHASHVPIAFGNSCFPLVATKLTWFVYIIQSLLDGSFYVGVTHDLQLRVQRHNDGWTRSTKGKRPWKVVYFEQFPTKSNALRREREIKHMKSRRYIERLILSRPVQPPEKPIS